MSAEKISEHLATFQEPMSNMTNPSLQNSHTPHQLKFLTREMTDFEIKQCESACQSYISNDDFEIEIHNLNEINEYFRIFKDIVVKN